MDVNGTRTLVLAHPFGLGPVAGTTVLLRALMRQIPALDPSTHTVYLDLDEEASPSAWVTRMRAASAGGLGVLGVNLHLERHEARSVELYEVCRREDLSAFVWVHDYWPHHERSVRRLAEDLGVTLLASSPTVRDALAGAGFPARVAQVGIALENLVIHERPPRAPAPFVVGSVGRLVRRKRHADVVRAFGRARLDGAAQLRLRLLPSLVYPHADDDALLAGVMRDADAVRASGGAVMIDREPAVRQDYGAYGVYVCASQYEGLSMTPIESIYSGCPALMSDIPAHREIARGLHPDDPDDVLFAPGDVDALAALLRDEVGTRRRGALLRDRLGEVRTEIEARWSIRGTARALLGVLDGDRAHGGPRAYGPPG